MATYKSKIFPSFFSSKSECHSPNTISSIEEGAALIKANLEFNQTGLLIAVPIPEEHSIDHESIETVIEQALSECEANGVRGKEVTPYVLERVNQLTSGKSLQANIALIENNASVGSKISVELSKLRNEDLASQTSSSRERLKNSLPECY